MWKLEPFTEKLQCISYITVSIFCRFSAGSENCRAQKRRTKIGRPPALGQENHAIFTGGYLVECL